MAKVVGGAKPRWGGNSVLGDPDASLAGYTSRDVQSKTRVHCAPGVRRLGVLRLSKADADIASELGGAASAIIA